MSGPRVFMPVIPLGGLSVGGNWYYSGSEHPAAQRYNRLYHHASQETGMRVVLYL